MSSEVSIDIDLEARGSARVVLVGFMGAGKTTVARRWALSGGPAMWFDSDREAVRLLGVDSVEQAFREVGETGWREAEREVVLARAAPLRRGLEVWSLGGGAVLDPEIQRAILDSTVVWLDAPIDVLWDRITQAPEARPLAGDRAAFEQLYEQRTAVYENLATCRVDTACELSELGLGRLLAEQLPPAWFGTGLAVGSGLLRRVHELTALCDRQVAIVADQAVDELATSVARRLRAAGTELVSDLRLPMGEWHKQLATVEQLVRDWSAAGLHRKGVVVAIGGGTLLDAAGFAASVYHRGIDWVSVPTTVTSQVDAGVGGKTGVNLGAVKNVVGTVHLPLATVIDPLAVDGLRLEHVREGFVEAAKTALLAGEPLLGAARTVADELALDAEQGPANGNGAAAAWQPGRSQAWLELVDGCAAYKDAVVGEDPFDTDGIRAQLNLGHTLGHAIEAATGGAVAHGAAVAIGIHAALELSVRELGSERTLVDIWHELCEPLGIQLRSPLAWSEIQPLLVHDKKRDRAGIAWTLLAEVGRPVTDVRVDMEQVRAVWETCIHHVDPARARARSGSDPRVLVLFGANLGQLGRRDVEHYGSQTLPELISQIEQWASERGLVADCRQTDSLERFLAALHESRTSHSAVIVNPGAWTHHERSLHDAIEPLPAPVVEVHLSDVGTREEWRRTSVIAPVVQHMVAGAGAEGYRTALEWLAQRLGQGRVESPG